MAKPHYPGDDYRRQIEAFQTDLAIWQEAFTCVYLHLDLGDDPFGSVLHILDEKLKALVENVPMPPTAG